MAARYSFDFKILTARFPFLKSSTGSDLLKLIGVIKIVLQAVITAINNTYDARFINTASGSDLDKHGITLDLHRNNGEHDDDYRTRLLTDFHDIPTGLTVASIKNAVNQVMGYDPEIDEYYKSTWEWPSDDPPIYSIFGKTSIGASYDTMTPNEKMGCKFNLSFNSDVELRQITAYLTGSPGTVAHCAIYSDNAGVPNTKIADADHTATIREANWYTFNFTDVQLSQNNDFWLVVNISGGACYYYYDSGTGNQTAENTDTPPPDDPFGTPTYSDRSVSIYASYHAFDWVKPFNSFGGRFYVAAILSTEPTVNQLNQMETNLVAKKPANKIVRIVEEMPNHYELFREIK